MFKDVLIAIIIFLGVGLLVMKKIIKEWKY